MMESEKGPASREEEDESIIAAGDPALLALDRSVVRKLDLTVLPITAAYYLLSFVDRSNIGNASIAGLKTDLHLTPHQYLVAITCTYLFYIAAELPANLLLKKIGPQILLPSMVCGWGLICTLTGLVQNYHGLIALRLMLGLVEGGLLPGLVLYLRYRFRDLEQGCTSTADSTSCSMFYRRKELQLRMAFFFSATSLSGAFSGLLAAAIIKMDGVGGQAGWRWIFYLEGIFTILFGAATAFILPSTPADSRFLSPTQKLQAMRRLELDKPEGEAADAFSWREVGKAFTSPQVVLGAVALFGNGCTLFSFGYFTPAIVSTFKESVVHTQLLTVPPFIVAFIGRRGASVIGTSALAVIGYIIFLTSTGRKAKYASLFLSITGVYGSAPALSTWVPNNSAPHFRKATAVAIGFTMTNSAGIMSTWLFPSTDAPLYRRGTIVNLSMAIMTGAFAGLNLLYLRYANKQKELRREALKTGEGQGGEVGKSGAEGDRHPEFIYTY
ncbi:hypothetical protein RQP46_003799 [Phenoliferia psychrophenolica]